MAKLSVNINKIATIRNSRPGNTPDLIEAARKCEQYGAQGITVHPRPDERHVRYEDVWKLKSVVTTEFNIEGNPKEPRFLALVLDVKPTQVTLVPDNPSQATSDHGWDTLSEQDFLTTVVTKLKNAGIRTSIFVDPNSEMIRAAAQTGTDRIELYTEWYARCSSDDAVLGQYANAAKLAHNLGLGVNAGHDLNAKNLHRFVQSIPTILEVSIGHALISDALYLGLEKTIQLYVRQL